MAVRGMRSPLPANCRSMRSVSGSHEDIGYRPHEGDPVRIVGDGAIAGPPTGGELVAAVVLDTSVRNDLHDYFVAHQRGAEGDVVSRWARRETDDLMHLSLVLEFSMTPRFERIVAFISFDLDSYGGLVDRVMQTERLFLLSSRDGSAMRPSNALRGSAPGIVLTVTTIPAEWQVLWTDAICAAHNVSAEDARGMQATWRAAFTSGS